MPHLYCLRDPAVLWLHVVSDLLTAVAYFAIPLVLFQVVHKRDELLFRRVAALFVAFIAACGTTHLLAVWTIWQPMYRLEGVVKAITAIVSIATAIVLLRLRAQILNLPSISELKKEIVERRRAEEATRLESEKYRSIVESVEEYALSTIDADGEVLTWNLGAERLKGYAAKEIVGRNFSCLFTKEDIAKRLPQEILSVAAETGRFEGEGWRIRKDRSRFWARVILRPMRDAAGAVKGFSKITHDLSESKAKEARYQAILDAAPDAILIVNRQGRIDFASAQMEKLFGYSCSEIVGASVDTLVPLRFRGTHGGHRHGFFNAPRTREMGIGRELFGLRKDGSEFSIEISLSPLETKDGTVALAAIRDVTERKKAETRFRALLESAPDSMVIVNSDGFIELANQQTEKLFGYSNMELVGQPVDVLVPLNLRHGHGEHRGRFFSAPKPRSMGAGLDLMALRKDGTQFPVEISLSPLEGPNGVLVTAAIRDVTDRREAARQLVEKLAELSHSNEQLEQFAYIASHDLLEPLRMIASYTQLLAKRYKGRLDPDADEFIGFAVDGTRRMKKLIEDLLLYSRTGKGLPPVREFPSGDAFQSALKNLGAAIEESHATITSDILPTIVAGESVMVQIFQNLIGNAIKYRGKLVPLIHASAHKGDKEWIFCVTDNGIGIDAQYFDRIFLIFQRLHGHDEYEGTGVGLAICKRILQQQGGRIWVESDPGRGSKFFFALPMRQA